MTLYLHLCDVKGLADFITPPGKNSSVANDLERIMCISPDAFMQAINNEASTQYITNQVFCYIYVSYQ